MTAWAHTAFSAESMAGFWSVHVASPVVRTYGPTNDWRAGLTVEKLRRDRVWMTEECERLSTFGEVKTLEAPMSSISNQLASYANGAKRIVVSSSFQTHSIPLLHVLTRLAPDLPVAFLDTGYHFPETLAFRDAIVERLDLDLVVVSGLETARERDSTNGLYVASESACCDLNKVQPMQRLLEGFDVWISGVRSTQTSTRNGFEMVMPGPSNTERYHPLLHWTDNDIAQYRIDHDLPAHPLDARGYSSIGCAPCTSPAQNNDRSGRWNSSSKTECGLHL